MKYEIGNTGQRECHVRRSMRKYYGHMRILRMQINVYVAVPGRNRTLLSLRISLTLLRSKHSSVELPLRAGLICAE